jgi:superfamily II DNA or RNA helicase
VREAAALHREAMELAEEAVVERLHGNAERAVTLLRHALERERAAASLVEADRTLEPTRSVLHRSAASLALECGELREAERLVTIALSGTPPDDIAEELRQLLRSVVDSVESNPAQSRVEAAVNGRSRLFNVRMPAPVRSSVAILREQPVLDPVFGTILRKRLYNLRHVFDPAFPLFFSVGEHAELSVIELKHPVEWVLADGPRPDPMVCFQRLRALWLNAENRAGQLSNDPVLPFRHQAALVEFLTNARAPERVLIADEVGLGKTVEVGLILRNLLKQQPELRVLYMTLGGLVENVLEEFHRLDLPRWYFFGTVGEKSARRMGAVPIEAITGDTRLVVASIHRLGAGDRFEQQLRYIGGTRFDVIVVDECHTLRAYGPSGDSPQVWFSVVRQLLEEHLTQSGRVLFLSATPHQGQREVFLNLIALCTGAPLRGSEAEKAQAARGKVVFRIKEHIRDWEGKRVFPLREVKSPILVAAPDNYAEVLRSIADHFDWVATAEAEAQARAVGFVKSQALQYAASSLRAGFAYLLRRLIRYYPRATRWREVADWARRLLPYRGGVRTVPELLARWQEELRTSTEVDDESQVSGQLGDSYGGVSRIGGEEERLRRLLGAYDALFDDANAGAKFARLLSLLDESDEPFVVFSQAVDTVYELEMRLRVQGVEVYRITGDMPFEARTDEIHRFRTSVNPRRVLVSSAAGGVGINLQVARRVVHFDLPWNPMTLEQRVGRVHRIGSVQTILIDTILLQGSREAEVFQRITERLESIVRDLSADPSEREALFRRILASLNPEHLRGLFAGERGIDDVGAAVDEGRRIVAEADRDMLEIAATAEGRQGRARTEHLFRFLRDAGANLEVVGRSTYGMFTEVDDGRLERVERAADLYRLDGDNESLVFDRVAAAYLQIQRERTGGLGHPSVDALVRASIDVTAELEKAKVSTWISSAAWPDPLRVGDIVYFELEARVSEKAASDLQVNAVVLNSDPPSRLSPEVLEELLWRTEWSVSRKAGEMRSADVMLGRVWHSKDRDVVRWPLAAIGLRGRE